MTPKMAIKTILLTTKAPKAEHRKKIQSSFLYKARDMQRCYTLNGYSFSVCGVGIGAESNAVLISLFAYFSNAKAKLQKSKANAVQHLQNREDTFVNS